MQTFRHKPSHLVEEMFGAPTRQMRTNERDSFTDFSASELYCPTCQAAMPVHEKLLLHLVDSSIYDYCCQGCGSSLGKKTG